MAVAGMQLARNIARDADAGRRCACKRPPRRHRLHLRHLRHLRAAVVDPRLPHCNVGNQIREGHGVWRSYSRLGTTSDRLGGAPGVGESAHGLIRPLRSNNTHTAYVTNCRQYVWPSPCRLRPGHVDVSGHQQSTAVCAAAATRATLRPACKAPCRMARLIVAVLAGRWPPRLCRRPQLRRQLRLQHSSPRRPGDDPSRDGVLTGIVLKHSRPQPSAQGSKQQAAGRRARGPPPERLLVYYGGTGRSMILGVLRATSMFIFAATGVVVAPDLVSRGYSWLAASAGERHGRTDGLAAASTVS